MPRVTAEDGTVHNFPDGTTPEMMSEALGLKTVGVGEDLAKTVLSKGAQGALSVPMVLPDLLNQAAAGPQMLYRGIRDTFQGNETDNSPLYKPFLGSEDIMEKAGIDYQPQTTAGKIVDIPAQILGSLAGAKGVQAVTKPANNFLSDVSSGAAPTPPKAPLPAGMENLDVLPDAAKRTMFAKKPNALESGIKANQGISEQFAVDTKLQRDLYSDLNQKGSVLSVKAPDMYNKLDDMVNYLEGKVAVDTPEYRVLTELKEYRDALNKKYGVAAIPDKKMQLPSWKQPMVVEKGTPGVAASGVEPSDLVDLKTTLNSGLKTNKFSNAGSAKIIEFKNYIQNALEDAKKVSPEFGAALDAAEKQAARVGLYKEDSLKQLWQPEDYMAYKAGNPLQADTQSRAAKFLDNLNNPALGRASSVANILPQDAVKQIFRDAIVNGRATKPNIPAAIAQLLRGHPLTAARVGISSMIRPEARPLEELSKQIRGMQKMPAPPATPPQYPQNLSNALKASILTKGN